MQPVPAGFEHHNFGKSFLPKAVLLRIERKSPLDLPTLYRNFCRTYYPPVRLLPIPKPAHAHIFAQAGKRRMKERFCLTSLKEHKLSLAACCLLLAACCWLL